MERFKKLGVFLHYPPADAAALQYAARFAGCAVAENLLCVHVREADADGAPPDPAELKKQVCAQLPAEVASRINVEVRTATGVAEILRVTHDQDLDLIVVGRRLPSEQIGIGSAFARLARKAPCSVLVVPTQSRPHLERAFVAVDFSDHSKLALETGIAIVRACGGDHPQLVVHSNAAVGYGYAKLGMTLPEALADRERTLRKDIQDFVKPVDTSGLDVEVLPSTSEDLDLAILESAIARKMDLIVLGSRGQAAALLLGSTSERVLLKSVLPVLIVKPKGETSRILDALFGA